jgi:MerR family transcriptional regulator, copper efflux regulator
MLQQRNDMDSPPATMRTPDPRTAAGTTPRNRQYNIGQAAENSGVSAKMIRHYESIGLVPKPERTVSNYRTYGENDIHTLRFIRRSRALGFSMKQIATLVSLWRNRSRSSASVRRLAQEHITELQTKIDSMQSMVRTLKDLSRHCHGDERPECPIIDDLAKAPVRKPKQRVKS